MTVSSSSKTRRRNERRGRWAESLALASLRLKGYRLLARRFKSGAGEVDLIMRRGEVTAFIEVKVRGTADLAVEAVTDFQTRRIAAAARIWMARDPKAALGICRFDIVTISPYQWPHHIPNAIIVED
ncbi:YraN family protein [Taklimakanibacter deserti]|uniref:YraN family protein n=1 Tax=Taklimakanibacter deserti TaxID=2267839 RepID=UPI000E646E95